MLRATVTLTKTVCPRLRSVMGASNSRSAVTTSPAEAHHKNVGMKDLVFRQLFDAESSTFTYILGDPETRESILIDPVLEQADRDLTIMDELDLKLIYAGNTHIHADHITGTGKIKEKRPDVKSFVAKASGAKADILLDAPGELNFGNQTVQVLPTPGHTNGCLTYYTEAAGGLALTGDALLIRGCGRTDFQEGDAGRLYDSVHSIIFRLPEDTAIYPAHDYKGRTRSSVWEEKRHNPRLTKSREEFVELMAKLGLAYPKKMDVAVPANLRCGIDL